MSASHEMANATVVPAKVPRPNHIGDGYIDPSLALPRAWWFSTVQWIVVAVAAGGDAANFYLALATVATQMQPYMLAAVISALTVAAVAIMYAVGVSARDAAAHGEPLHRAYGLLTLTGLWIFLGAAAFALRMMGSEAAAVNSGGLTFEDGTSVAGPIADHDRLLLASMMLVLYLATGGLAAWFAYHHHNPYYTAAKRARKAILRINKQVAALRVAELRYEEHVKLLLEQSAHEAERRDEDLAICAAHALELKELARSELATRLRDPAATSTLTNTQLPAPDSATHFRKPVDPETIRPHRGLS